jgi:hypothetical protein
MHISAHSTIILAISAFCLGCGVDDELTGISGTVSIDGLAAESGTIHFQPVAESQSRGAGASINAGAFEVSDRLTLKPGEYKVVIQAFKRTEKIFKDPQRGDVPVTVVIDVADSPKRINVTSENFQALSLTFASRPEQRRQANTAR